MANGSESLKDGQLLESVQVNQVKVFEASHFSNAKQLCDQEKGWTQVFKKKITTVWTRDCPSSDFKTIKARTEFNDVSADLLYDVLHDPDFRSSWDKYMLKQVDIGILNPNNDLCYYARRLPTWLVNKVTKIVAPKVLKKLHKACGEYPNWKQKHNPNWKPWLNPDQLCNMPRIELSQCVAQGIEQEEVDETDLELTGDQISDH